MRPGVDSGVVARRALLRNAGFGSIVGGVIAVGVIYAYIVSPAEPADPGSTFYLTFAIVLGLSVAALLTAILMVAAARNGNGSEG